jgi:hypothetical protein
MLGDMDERRPRGVQDAPEQAASSSDPRKIAARSAQTVIARSTAA